MILGAADFNILITGILPLAAVLYRSYRIRYDMSSSIPKCKKCGNPLRVLSSRHGSKSVYKATEAKICRECKVIAVPRGSGFRLATYER